MLHVVDLERAARDAHAGGALLCCDNTVATPLLTRPLELGADISWQSATKSLAGHSDTLAGVISVRDPELHEQIQPTRRMFGGVLAPDPAWLLLRGLRRSRCGSSGSARARSSSPGGSPSTRR